MRNVWAIAKNTLAQAMRMKLAFVVILFLLVVLPSMSLFIVGDGTLLGKLQTFCSYSLSLTSLLLCILTLSIASYTLSNDIKEKLIFNVVTKPVARFQIILGKFLGIVALNLILLVVFATAIYFCTFGIIKFGEYEPAEVTKVQNEFLTARNSVEPEDISDEIKIRAQERYDILYKKGSLPEGMMKTRVLKRFRNEERIAMETASPGEVIRWRFKDVKPSSETKTVSVRFKYDVPVDPPDMNILSRWNMGDFRQIETDAPTEVFDTYTRKDSIRTFHEIEVPTAVIASDGFLEVAMMNDYRNGLTVMPKEIEVLYKAGGFTLNYIKAVILIFIRMVFLAALGVSMTAWLSFPVAILVCIIAYLIGTINGFVISSFGYLSDDVTLVYNMTVNPILMLCPKFDEHYNPTPMIISARMISWYFVGKMCLATMVIRSGLLLLLGMLIFARREIAKVIV